MIIITQVKAALLALILLLAGLFPAALLACPFGLRRRLKIICPVWAFSARMLLRFGCGAKILVDEDHRSPEYRTIPTQGLYVANHQSYIDIPLLLTKYQAPPIMKKEILYIPIFGWIGWVSGAMPVSRGKHDSRKRVFEQTRRRILQDKIAVQVYPEGTRSRDALPRPYHEIKRTLMVFAFNEKVPVIPTSVYGTRGVLRKNGTIRPGRSIGIIVHKEMHPGDFSSVEEFCSAVWDKVTLGHDQMKLKLAPLNEN